MLQTKRIKVQDYKPGKTELRAISSKCHKKSEVQYNHLFTYGSVSTVQVFLKLILSYNGNQSICPRY